MTQNQTNLKCDLLVIGTGMAGMASALFAAEKKIDTIQVGITAEIGFASGFFDLLGVHPVSKGAVLTNPWNGLTQLCRQEPDHPYARLKPEDIEQALRVIGDFFAKSGYPYHRHPDRNMTLLTPAGTLKTTYMAPHTMAFGDRALSEQLPTLLVDFEGLKGFSGWQIALCQSGNWPGLRPVRLKFPGSAGELYTERMARSLDTPKVCKTLADLVKPHLGDAKAVAFPAVLGVHRTVTALETLTRELGVPVFEIPTIVPTVTGVRLREIFEQRLPALGVRSFFQQKVLKAKPVADGRWGFEIGRDSVEAHILAKSAVLCSGRFLGRGLHADRHGIRETIFNLPVVQPQDRSGWHHKDLFNSDGHPINRAGIAIDNYFRPVAASGKPVYANLFAAGSILAHQDWMRQKCGSGLAIATAFGAVAACRQLLEGVQK